MILYSFYKNFVLTFTLFYFCFYTGFSGQVRFPSLRYYSLYHCAPGFSMQQTDRQTDRHLSPFAVAHLALWLRLSSRSKASDGWKPCFQ